MVVSPDYEKMLEITTCFFNAQFDRERSLERLFQTLSSTFKIVSTGIAFVMDLQGYLQMMQEKHYENIVEVIDFLSKSQHFPGKEPGTILWKIDTLQHRLGKGFHEEGEGLYKISAECTFHFAQENHMWKIAHLLQANYLKEKI